MTTALLAVSTIYLAWQLGEERARGARLADSRVIASTATSGGASVPGGTSTPSAERARADDAQSPGLLERIGAAFTGAGKKRAPRQLKIELMQQDFRRLYDDPVTRRQLIEELVPAYRDQFLVLERRLKLGTDQWQRFLETVAEQAVERRGNSAVCGKDLECWKQVSSSDARYEQAIRDLLGAANVEKFETFNYSVAERQDVEALQSRLPEFQRLSESAAEDLIVALSEVRRDAEKRLDAETGGHTTIKVENNGENYTIFYPGNLATPREQLAYVEAHQQQLRDRANALLNANQLSVFDEWQARTLRTLRRKMTE